MPKIAIIGAGITGLTAAYALKKQGHEVAIFEKSNVIGGVIQTIDENGFLSELGPSTLQLNDLRILNLIKELDLENEILDNSPHGQERFIVKQGIPTPAPRSPISFLKTSLFSTKAKLRLLKEPLIQKSQNPDETVADFIRRRLGHEILDYAADPFVSGIYAGNPNELSVRYAFPRLYGLESEYGSLIKAAFKKKKDFFKIKTRTISFKNGMHTLPSRLGKVLNESIHLNTNIVSIAQKECQWEIAYKQGGTIYKDIYNDIIITIPAYQLKDLPFDDPIHQALKPLDDIPYAPIAVVTHGFKRESVSHKLNGFGMLIPSKENFKTLGTLFSSSMFPEHTPERYVALRTFIGGSRSPNIANEPAEIIENNVWNDLFKLLKINGIPAYTHIKVYNQAIPQYNLGYQKYLSIMDSVENSFDGLHIIGNYRSGISLPQCILTGLNAGTIIQKDV